MKKLAPASTPPVRRDLLVTHSRLKAALSDPTVTALVHEDLSHTLFSLEKIDISHFAASRFISWAFEHIRDSPLPLLGIEANIRHDLAKYFPNVGPALAAGLSGRAGIIADQLRGHIHPGWRIADLGCGDGKVAAEVLRNFGPSYLIGFDIVNYLAEGVDINFSIFDGKNVPICLPNELHSFDCVLLGNVLHHAELNGWLITSAHRLLKPGGKALVHETVPSPHTYDTPGFLQEIERVFVVDYFYNRILHDADIRVPGTYEKIHDWKARFELGGRFRQNSLTDLGIDQPLIRDWHILCEFEALIP